jgi:hypothetical protein
MTGHIHAIGERHNICFTIKTNNVHVPTWDREAQNVANLHQAMGSQSFSLDNLYLDLVQIYNQLMSLDAAPALN